MTTNEKPLPERGWPEDSHLENGNYINQCTHCGHTFVGHKRRVFCKLCSVAEAPEKKKGEKQCP